MERETYPEQSVFFARIEGRNADGSEILGQPRVIGSISPLEGREKEVGILRCDLPPTERGIYFVIRNARKERNGQRETNHDRERD